jgi:hypothetical protein
MFKRFAGKMMVQRISGVGVLKPLVVSKDDIQLVLRAQREAGASIYKQYKSQFAQLHIE